MDILMPQLGETVAEGKITTWFKAPGDTVAAGDNLFEIETDKVSMEVPAISGGVLQEIRVTAGQVAPVGAVVAVLGNVGDGAAASGAPPVTVGAPPAQAAVVVARPSPAAPVAVSTVAATAAAPAPGPLDPFHPIRTPARNFGPARMAGGRTVTPLARRLAAEAGIDLDRVAPSGPHGRIYSRDVTAAISAGSTGAVSTRASAPTAERVKALYETGSFDEVPLDAMRRTIAARLVEAKQTVPHFYLSCDVALDRLLAVRAEANAALAAGPGGAPTQKLSVNDFVVKALVRALGRVPAANAVFAEDRILRFSRIDVGVAVALDGGLITPVVRDAGSKPLGVLSAEIKDLAARAKERRLKPDEYKGGVSTVSNLGMYGVREFAAIINPPQSTLLAVGAAERRPVEAANSTVRFETRMTVTLSCDHRVVDGALGAELLAAFRHAIEHPIELLV